LGQTRNQVGLDWAICVRVGIGWGMNQFRFHLVQVISGSGLHQVNLDLVRIILVSSQIRLIRFKVASVLGKFNFRF